MAPVILFFLMAIIQGQGPQASVYGTEGDCLVDRAEMAAKPDTLALSDCIQIKLEKVLPKT